MTSKRKAELQRKLTLSAVPRPPEDLADRIKADIPKYLNVEAERARFSRSVGFNLRIAASFLVLISIAAAMLMFIPERETSPVASMAPRPAAKAESQPGVATTTMAATTEEVRVDIVQQAAPASAPAQIADASVPPPARRRAEEGYLRDALDSSANTSVEGGVEGESAGGVMSGVVGGVAGGRVTEAAAPPAEFAPMPAPVPPPPPPAEYAPEPARESALRVTASAPAAPPPAAKSSDALIPQAYAYELKLAPKSVFGISVDPEVFRRVKTTIESGNRPAPASVNIEALVNYFAGAPTRRVRRGVRLEAEASPAPVGANGRRAILRFTIDTASIGVAERGSVPPIATDARLEIDFNRDAVERFTPIGDASAPTSESALLHNISVTGLYELHLRTPLNAKQRVATIRLRYRDVKTGRQHTLVEELHGADFARPWHRSSRRHRLASLGALWGQSLRESRGGTEVAKRAEELASQQPNDERARELARVAVASSGGTN